MTARLITPPATLPVTMVEARAAARVDGTDLDSEIVTAVRGLVADVEHLTGRAIIHQTWRVTLDAFPDAVKLPKPPVAQVVSAKYLDLDGIEQTLDPADYLLDDESAPCYLVPAYGKSWPATRNQINAVKIEVVCGYGATEASTPHAMRAFILARLQEKFAPAGAAESPHLVRMLDEGKVY